jgi:hypothetical protein
MVGNRKDLVHVDLSIMPSLKCDLACPFCMYYCGPENTVMLDLEKLRRFLATVDWRKVTNVGFYGGEPSVDVSLYQQFIDLVPAKIPRFTITNGAWSTDPAKTKIFLEFCRRNRLVVFVSGTPYHRGFQDRKVLRRLAGRGLVRLKDADEMHPMGRLAKKDWTCTRKCLRHRQPVRLAVFPTGHIIFQNCDGVYPVLGDCSSSFKDIFAAAVAIRSEGCRRDEFPNINRIMKECTFKAKHLKAR